MTGTLTILAAGPGLTVQDMGRPGFLAQGLSCGGAADRLALHEGAALLAQSPDLAVLEMAGLGGRFTATCDVAIALSGAPMRTTLDGAPLQWNAAHRLPRGAMLDIGPARAGSYGYLHVAGGLHTPDRLGAKGTHLAAGIGAPLTTGETLALAPPDPLPLTPLMLPVENRFEGGEIRVLRGLQTDLFEPATLARFAATPFTRDPRGNRMGVRLASDGPGFQTDTGLSILSEVILPGDIQIAGDGAPYILLAECGTTGGYPRIATVLPADLPRVAQAPPGAPLSFRFIDEDAGLAAERAAAAARAALPNGRQPLKRDPRDIADLLSYHLISGATDGRAQDT